ncbi:hypothetical protein UB39_21500 [Photobacterium angustum]|nr:hypothetical protein UB39_21500 [Photobacterium angustum]
MNNSESSSSTVPQTVTLLPPPDKQPFGAEQVLFRDIKTCAKDESEIEYKDIAYFIEGNAFYLLDDTACDYFAEAEKVFQGKKNSKDLMDTLAQSNTLNGLLSADITSFITEEDKKDYQELEKCLDNPQPYLREMTNAYAAAEWVKVQKEKRQVILDKAQKLAESQGYTFEDGQLYSYREPKIQKAIKKYLEAREIFLKEAELTPQTQLETLKERLASLNRLHSGSDKLAIGYHVKQAADYCEKYLSKEIKNTEDKLEELTTSIEELSLLGIATPD